MPERAKKPCSYPGCPALVVKGRCDRHRKQEFDAKRGTAAQRGYDYRWQRYTKYYIAMNPLCVYCKQQNRITPSAVVDHIIPHKGDKNLFWDTENHQALCKRCHDRKTARERGEFCGQERKSDCFADSAR